MPLLDPQLRIELNKIREAINDAPEAVREIQDIAELNDSMSEIKELKRSIRRDLRDVLEVIDSGEQPALSQIEGLRDAVVAALQHIRRPGGPPLSGDDTDG